MNTVQMYTGKGNNIPQLLQAAKNAASTFNSKDNRQPARYLSTAEFIRQNSHLIGLPADELDDQLRTLLIDYRVGYNNPKNAFSLLTGLLPDLASSVDTHFALLLRGGTIVGMVCINLNHSLPETAAANYLALDDIDGRYLVSRSVEVGATGLLLISTRNGRPLYLDPTERAYITKLQQSMELMSVDLEDWLLFIDEEIVSCLASHVVAAPAAPVSAEVFINRHRDLIGLPPAELALQFTERLKAGPVHYATVLDAITLLRAFTPTSEAYPNANYALLFRDWSIVGFAYLPNQKGSEPHAIATHESDNRHLMRYILSLDADKVLLATQLSEEESIDVEWFKEVEAIQATAMWYGYEHLDWLMLLPNENLSYVLETAGEEMLDGGVTYEKLVRHYVGFSGNVPPTTAA